MLQHLINNIHNFKIFCFIICQVVTYRRLKTKENFKFLAQKVAMFAYERWLLTRASKYSELALKLLIF